jgi:hypothetical protein
MRQSIFSGLLLHRAVLFSGKTMPHKPPKIERRIINLDFPRFVIAKGRRYWTGKGWSRKLRRALLYAHADPLRDDIEKLKLRFS